ATPMSIMVGVGRGAQHGVLIRDAEALQRLEAVTTVVVDKTGTLTEGAPKVVEVVCLGGVAEADLISLAASLERSSEHPLARAIVEHAQDAGVSLQEAAEFDSPNGKGVVGTVQGQRVALGNRLLMESLQLPVAKHEAQADRLRADGATVIFVAVGEQVAGLLAIADPV
ncbi:MAG TPA: haloacid dehalogenase, partial [Pseudomonas sp.]|nr:haloacid dehalogenase [Pseudomonas sp.]